MFSFFSKKRSIVALDINSHHLSLLALTKYKTTGKIGYELHRYVVLETPPGSVREGLLIDPEAIAEVIKVAIADMGLPGSPKVQMYVPAQSVVVRLMPVPAGIPNEELADVVTQEAATTVPFPMEEACVDFVQLYATERTDADGVSRLDVMIAAAQKPIIDSYRQVCDLAGVQLGKIDVSSLTAIRALSWAGYFDDGGDEGLFLSVNLRNEASDINLIKQGMPVFSRSVLIGFDTLVEGVSRSLGVPYEEAVEILPKAALSDHEDPMLAQAAQVIRTALSDITDEISRSLDFYRSQVGDVNIEQIFLTGPACQVPLIDQYVSNRLNVPAIIADPMKFLVVQQELIPEVKRPGLASVMGLLADPKNTIVPTVSLDLNKESGIVIASEEEDFEEAETRWFKPVLGVGVGLLAIVLVGWIFLALIDLPNKTRQIEELTTEIDRNKKKLSRVPKVKEDKNQLEKRKIILESLIQSGHPWVAVMEAIRDNTPPGVRITRVTMNNNSLTINGATNDFTPISYMAIDLGQCPIFTNCSIKSGKRSDDDFNRVEFELTAEIKPETAYAPKLLSDPSGRQINSQGALIPGATTSPASAGSTTTGVTSTSSATGNTAVSTGSSVSTSTTTTTQSTGSANKTGVTTVAAKGGKLPKVLEFYATWCTPCKKLKPFVDEAAKKYKGKIEVEDINIDDPKSQLICDQYKVKAVPTVVFLQPDGKVYHQFVGFKKREEVLNQFDNLLRASEAGK